VLAASLACADEGRRPGTPVNRRRTGTCNTSRNAACATVPDLKGGGAPEAKRSPALFEVEWAKPLADLYAYTRQQMPKGTATRCRPRNTQTSSLSYRPEWHPVRTIKLAADSPMNRVLILSDAASVAAQSAPAEQVQLGELAGRVKQPSTSRPTHKRNSTEQMSAHPTVDVQQRLSGERYSRLSQLNAHTRRRSSRCALPNSESWAPSRRGR